MNNFLLGCNYWASNAGAEMWVDFCPDSIDKDLKTLSENGIKHLRVFPNWRDFQPVMPLCVWDKVEEYRMVGEKRPKNKYYLCETALERFNQFCDIAGKYNLQIVVGLITGWMSGRLFVPPFMYGKNPYTDPTALLFQQKFVAGFVSRFKHRPEIYAWDLGNECNCMYPLDNRYAAHNWTLTLSNTIRANDSARPVVSGMHNMTVEGTWTIEDQGDATDILTTHPYPYWGYHTRIDTYSDIRTLLHATCETKFFSDLGGKPCFVEELGTMGPMNCDEEIAAGFVRANLYSNWANGAAGVMWWCAHEQVNLFTPPYTWNMCEIELGMTDKNGQPKPVLKEFKAFSEFLAKKDFELPPAQIDGVCLLTKGQDQWGIAYMSYILAKQANVNIRFAFAEQELPESDVYLLPAVKGHLVMSRERYLEIIKRVESGATLYISNDECILSEFSQLTGATVVDSRQNKRYLKPTGATVLATDEEGNPTFTSYAHGKGMVYYMDNAPEKMLLDKAGGFTDDTCDIYAKIFKDANHIVKTTKKDVGITQHHDKDFYTSSTVQKSKDFYTSYAVVINYSGEQVAPELTYNDNYKLVRQIGGTAEKLAPFSSVILEFEKI